MKSTLKLVPLAALIALGAALPVAAQGLVAGIKFGAGPALGSIGTQGSRANINLALTCEYGLGAKQEVFAELGYRAFRAEDYEATRIGTGYLSNGTTGPIVPQTSVDMRKDQLEGFTLGLGFRRQIGDTNFRWQGGLLVSALKSQQEVTGMITVTNGANTYREGLSCTPRKTAIKPGAFAGIQYRFTDSFFVESNVGVMDYKQVNYVPFAYTGQAAHSVSTDKSKVVFDLNCGFRF